MKSLYWRVIITGWALATACGTSVPSSPTPPASGPNAFAGTWVPIIGVDSCTGTLACIAFDSEWLVLRLAPEGPRLVGSAYLAGKSFDVNATLDASDDLVITTPPRRGFSLEELRLHAGAAGLTGTVRYTGGPMVVRGHITSAKHGPLEPTLLNVQGTWMGDSLVRSCTLTGLTECPSLSRLFRLSLTHNGTSASGNLDLDASERFRIPVRGGFSASALTLEGVSSRQQAGGTFQQRLVAWTSRSDSFGRMNGTFTLEEESVSPDRRVVVHYESDLQDVYLIPDWFQPSSLASIAAAAGPTSLQPRLSVR